jgi:MFS family permease
VPRRGPVLAGFTALGLYWGAWAAVVPSVQRAVGASKGALGLALLFTALGLLPSMLFLTGPLVRRFGARTVAVTATGFAVVTTLPGLATSLPVLMLTLALVGAGSGAMDVAINAAAARIEAVDQRRLMPLAHGLYSVGILVGASAAGLARGAGVGREPILLTVSVALALTAVWAAPDAGPLQAEGTIVRNFHFERALVVIGLVGAAAFLVEGAIENWSALFLERQLDARPQVSGLGPGVFGASMAAARFAGQWLRLPERALLAGGAVVSAAGCAIAAAAPTPAVALVGFALGGAGMALNAPLLFGAAGRRSATAIATVTTIGYAGIVIGPPIVGGVAQLTSLRVSFVLLALVAVAVAATATRLPLGD